ncbi:MAG: aromatic ring-hydroxylating dioxygenase subunit alpha [Proteobacteria bacterium]|nr:aromatic ring-hydroxylating dioxygenase subunit alpha [Pseudomonadota bacterium]
MLRVDLYSGEAALRTDRAQVLRRSWQFVGHDSMAPNPGDYIAETVGGAPVVVVRNSAGALAGFHNVCRHRAGLLVADGAGHCGEHFVCRYHGWRYSLDGRLRSATDFGVADGFDPRELGLFPIRVETWRGLVFVNLDLEASPLADVLSPLADEPPFPHFPLTERRSHRLACNWKTYVENYLEGYHLPMVHPEFDADVVVADYRVEIEGQVIFQAAPPRNASVYAGTWAWLWPNLAINTYRHGYMIERMTAVGPEETRLDYFYFFDPARAAELAQMFEASDRVTAQDKQVCEEVQRNLSAGVYRGGVLSPKHERGVAWFQARIAEAHGEPAPAGIAEAVPA